MARPKKDGLDYYPMDSDIANDDKVKYIRSKHGNDGFATVILLLNKIYKEKGYFCHWTTFEKTIFSADSLLDVSKLDEIIESCIECRFFDEKKYKQYQILTSKGIQNRFMEASKRRRDFVVTKEYVMNDVDINPNFGVVNVNINPVQDELILTNAEIIGKEERKEEKGKRKEERGKGKEEIKESVIVSHLDELIHYFAQNISPVSPTNATDLKYDLEDFNDDLELLKAAVDICARKNIRNYKFFAGILKNWRAEGVTTYAQYLDKEKTYNDKKSINQEASEYDNLI